MTKSACCRVPITRTEKKMISGFGQYASATAIATAMITTSERMASEARHPERRVSSRTSALGSALRKSSLNSSPFTLLVEPADQDVFDLQVFLEAVLRSLATQSRLFNTTERRDLGGDDADVGADDA